MVCKNDFANKNSAPKRAAPVAGVAEPLGK